MVSAMSLNSLLVRPATPSAERMAWRPVASVSVVSVFAAVAFLVVPPMGIDLSAQTAHGNFWARHGAAVVDFGWYGGVSPFGYSLLTPGLMAGLGGGTDGARA